MAVGRDEVEREDRCAESSRAWSCPCAASGGSRGVPVGEVQTLVSHERRNWERRQASALSAVASHSRACLAECAEPGRTGTKARAAQLGTRNHATGPQLTPCLAR